jgi:hypothetical protein
LRASRSVATADAAPVLISVMSVPVQRHQRLAGLRREQLDDRVVRGHVPVAWDQVTSFAPSAPAA